jgi:hypothetical protein
VDYTKSKNHALPVSFLESSKLIASLTFYMRGTLLDPDLGFNYSREDFRKKKLLKRRGAHCLAMHHHCTYTQTKGVQSRNLLEGNTPP